MKDLIAKLEAATAETEHIVIEDALDFAYERGWIDIGQYIAAMVRWRAGAYLCAALTLVLEGWAWHVAGADEDGVGDKRPYACCVGPAFEVDRNPYEPPDADREVVEARAYTPALALCIAALKARAAA